MRPDDRKHYTSEELRRLAHAPGLVVPEPSPLVIEFVDDVPAPGHATPELLASAAAAFADVPDGGVAPESSSVDAGPRGEPDRWVDQLSVAFAPMPGLAQHTNVMIDHVDKLLGQSITHDQAIIDLNFATASLRAEVTHLRERLETWKRFVVWMVALQCAFVVLCQWLRAR